MSVEIEGWLSNEEIANFNQRVMAKSRWFIVGEVDAMREHLELYDQRVKDAEQENKIDKAYNAIRGTVERQES